VSLPLLLFFSVLPELLLLRFEVPTVVDDFPDVLAFSFLWPDSVLEAGLELMVSDDLLFVAGTCSAFDFVLALSLTVELVRCTEPSDLLVVPLVTPDEFRLVFDWDAALLPLLPPVEEVDTLSG
jgi:hypothetical protein